MPGRTAVQIDAGQAFQLIPISGSTNAELFSERSDAVFKGVLIVT